MVLSVAPIRADDSLRNADVEAILEKSWGLARTSGPLSGDSPDSSDREVHQYCGKGDEDAGLDSLECPEADRRLIELPVVRARADAERGAAVGRPGPVGFGGHATCTLAAITRPSASRMPVDRTQSPRYVLGWRVTF